MRAGRKQAQWEPANQAIGRPNDLLDRKNAEADDVACIDRGEKNPQ
jgi:hypothetical protein